MGLYRWLITGSWNAPANVGNPYIGNPLANPFEIPETPDQLMARRLKGGECPDCRHTLFVNEGAMKGPENSVIKFERCANCGSKFKIRFIDHPLLPIEAERLSEPTSTP